MKLENEEHTVADFNWLGFHNRNKPIKKNTIRSTSLSISNLASPPDVSLHMADKKIDHVIENDP